MRDRTAQERDNIVMARFVLAIMAILALAISPIAATAAPMTCGMQASSALGVTPPDGTSTYGSGPAPCCHKALKICASICLSICGVAVLPPMSSVAVPAIDMTPEPASGPAVHRYQPPGPDHPPKLPA